MFRFVGKALLTSTNDNHSILALCRWEWGCHTTPKLVARREAIWCNNGVTELMLAECLGGNRCKMQILIQHAFVMAVNYCCNCLIFFVSMTLPRRCLSSSITAKILMIFSLVTVVFVVIIIIDLVVAFFVIMAHWESTFLLRLFFAIYCLQFQFTLDHFSRASSSWTMAVWVDQSNNVVVYTRDAFVAQNRYTAPSCPPGFVAVGGTGSIILVLILIIRGCIGCCFVIPLWMSLVVSSVILCSSCFSCNDDKTHVALCVWSQHWVE